MADIKIAGRIKAGAADGISGYASEILFDDAASNKTVKEKIEEVASSPQTMIVTIAPDGNDGYEADKTFAEIKAFIDNGGTVIAKDEEDGDSYYYLDNYIASEVVFTRNIWGSGGFSTRYYTIDNTNTVSFIDSVHHISSAVDSSSTTNLANSAAVKALRDALADKQDTLTFDNTPTANSNNPVKSGGIKTALDAKQDTISDIDTIRSNAAAGATAVQPAAMNTALAAKQDTLTFDNAPTANSSNPVKSSGIKTALDAKQSTISTVNVTVDNNTGTPSGSASVSGSTLSLSFQNLKGATGATGATGPQGPQGERGLPGESGVTGDVSGFTVIQTIDPSATYGATDIAGAATVQATSQELTELAGEATEYYKKDIPELELNTNYVEGDRVLGVDGDMRRVNRRITTLDHEVVSVGDLKTNDTSGTTYKALKAISTYNGSNTYADSDYAFGWPEIVTATVTMPETVTEGDLTITIGDSTSTLAVTTETVVANVVNAIAAMTVDGWILTAGDGVVTMTADEPGNVTPPTVTFSGDTGITVSQTSVNGGLTTAQYSSGAWTSKTLANLIADSTLYEAITSVSDLQLLCTEANTLNRDIEEDELIVAKALCDHEERLKDIEANTEILDTEYVIATALGEHEKEIRALKNTIYGTSKVINNLPNVNLIIVSGQSLANGSDTVTPISTTTKYDALRMLGNYANAYHIDSAVFRALKEGAIQPAAVGGIEETPCSGCGEKLMEIIQDEEGISVHSTFWNNHKFVFTDLGKGSTSIQYHINNISDVYAVINRTATLCKGLGWTMNVPAFIWIQGETDMKNATTYSDYKTRLETLRSLIDTKAKEATLSCNGEAQSNDVSCICYQTNSFNTTFGTGVSGNNTLALTHDNALTKFAVPMAQLELVRNNPLYSAVSPTYNIDHHNGNKDTGYPANIHLTNIGSKMVGNMAAIALKRILFGQVENNGVVPSTYSVSGNTITITYLVNVRPLRINTEWVKEVENYGFKVINTSNQNILTSVSVFDNQVTLTCSESPVGAIALYGYNGTDGYDGRVRGARGNLCDHAGDIYHALIKDYSYVLDNYAWAFAFEVASGGSITLE